HASYTCKVCNAGTLTCSNQVTLTFGRFGTHASRGNSHRSSRVPLTWLLQPRTADRRLVLSPWRLARPPPARCRATRVSSAIVLQLITDHRLTITAESDEDAAWAEAWAV